MHKLGSGLELCCGLFSFQVALSARKVIILLFYHLAVLDYKPCYSQEPWLRCIQISTVGLPRMLKLATTGSTCSFIVKVKLYLTNKK